MHNETLIKLLQHNMKPANEDEYYDESSDDQQEDNSYEGEAEIMEDPSADIAIKQNALRMIREKYLGK